ncbi:MAG: glycosyltransferase family 2 protein [Eubacterium sp.]|nr:glycosyltransferase family 2 protein [Eubacterium sp.]
MSFVSKIAEPRYWKKGVRYIRQFGIKETFKHFFGEDPSGGLSHDEWFRQHRIQADQIEEQKKVRLALNPRISIVIPLYNTKIRFLKDLLASVEGQTYANWELCLADGSTNDKVKEYLEQNVLRGEPRIHYRRLEKNLGIAGNTNAAIEMASGDYIALCDHDDFIEPDALFEIAKAISEKPETDVLYTDEDLCTGNGKEFMLPRFKPDFNPDFLACLNYICHMFVVRKKLLDEIGGIQTGYDGAQDWDLILRCTEKTNNIVHIPRILYHWRAYQGSTAGNEDSKTYAIEAGQKAVSDHFKRIGVEADLEYTDIFVMFRPHLKVLGNPKVSILIPNKDHIDILKTCVDSIIEKSTYKNYEIILIENNSTEDETFAYYKELTETYDFVRTVTWKSEFNYSAINNFGAGHASGDYLVLLNNDTEVITPDWMEQMLGYCQRPDTGIVGAKLLYPDNTVQHCGVVIGIGGFAGHVNTLEKSSDVGFFGRLQAVQDVSCVTAACLMVRKNVFDEVGGLDGVAFKVALNDVDFCLRVREKGYLVVCNPGVQFYHYESKTRGSDETPENKIRFKGEIARFRERWKKILAEGDPYYNPNLTLMYGDCRTRIEGEHFDIIDEIEREQEAQNGQKQEIS